MRYLLDTNAMSELMRGPVNKVAAAIERVGPDAVCTSIVVVCELKFGAARRQSAKLTANLTKVLETIVIEDFKAPADAAYAELYLNRLGEVAAADDPHDAYALTSEAARHLALCGGCRLPGLAPPPATPAHLGDGSLQLSQHALRVLGVSRRIRQRVARLPQRLLAHGNGGALAVVGHIEKAWEWSFYSQDADRPNVQAFTSAFRSLLGGDPIGRAMEFINARYAELASDLDSELEEIRTRNKPRDPERIAQLWIAKNDCRNYAVLGDPAVRLRV